MGTLDIDNAARLAEAEESALPWDLVLKIGGIEYKTRPPTNAQVQQLSQVRNIGGQEQLGKLLDGLIELAPGQAIDWHAMSDRYVAAVVIAFTVYFQEQAKKNRRYWPRGFRRRCRLLGRCRCVDPRLPRHPAGPSGGHAGRRDDRAPGRSGKAVAKGRGKGQDERRAGSGALWE